MKYKRGMEQETLGYALLTFAIIVVIAIAVYILRDKIAGAIDYIKQLFRFK